MIKNLFLFVFLLKGYTTFTQQTLNNRFLFDNEWKFFRGGLERGYFASYNDSSWRTLNLPHDFSIEDIRGTDSPFDPDAISQVGGGFTNGGTGWYRKKFRVRDAYKEKNVRIVFDGVYMNADVWVNNIPYETHAYGYTSFYFDISASLVPGDNIIAVQVKNEGQTSRWYSGSGIYRHVWIEYLDKLQLKEWGTHVTCSNINSGSATVNISTAFENKSEKNEAIKIVSSILNQKGELLKKISSEESVAALSSGINKQQINISKPILWSVDQPFLYRLVTELYAGAELKQKTETKFGVREIQFDAAKGFLLNGKMLKLKGGCFHNDNGPLGAASFDRAEIRRVELMKASGFNAIRCSHNPPSPSFLDACDELGILVIDEAFDMWEEGKNPYDYHLFFKDNWRKDVQNMVDRDMNHPSIILWSIGNEIPNRERKDVVETGRKIVMLIRELDSTRPITSAVNDIKEDKDPYFSLLDVAGYNYARSNYEKDHERIPSRIMMGTESYALEAFDYWMSVEDHPWVIGDFIWTGFDYIGEASIGWRGYYQEKNFYPWNLAYCGDIDICGWKRPQSYYRDALWKKNQLSLFVKPPVPSFPLNPNIETWSIWNWHDVVPDWNWKGYEDSVLDVQVYSSCEAAELFLNGKSLGKKTTDRSTKFMTTWKVPYHAGVLKVVGYKNKKKINEAQLITTSGANHIALSADKNNIRANGQDLSYITVELKDSANNTDPKADDLIEFSIDGPATIVGVGNANPVSLESYQQPHRKAWRGKCLVIIRASTTPGTIKLSASSQGAGSREILIRSDSVLF